MIQLCSVSRPPTGGPFQQTGPPITSDCGTFRQVRSYWPNIVNWMSSYTSINARVDMYIHNATQRGVYQFTWGGGGTLYSPAPATPCTVIGSSSGSYRTFQAADCFISGNYNYSPCASAGPCNGGSTGFYNPRSAKDKIGLKVLMNRWHIDEGYRENKNISPVIYWDTPSVWFDSGCKGGKGSVSSPSLIGEPCFDVPVYPGTEYGCNTTGYDCFGNGGDNLTERAQDQVAGKGYWSFDVSGNSWQYNSTWYWRNFNPHPCGNCTFASPIKSCGIGNNSGSDCSNDCRDRSNPDATFACCDQHCGDHDLWQSGSISITLSLGSQTNSCPGCNSCAY